MRTQNKESSNTSQDAEIFAEWMRRQGQRVFRTESSYWHQAGPHVLQAFPYHWVISPSEEEIQRLMTRHGIIALRYSTPVDAPIGMLSYHIVRKPPYDLPQLKSQARNGVKRGLAHFHVEQISFERLATEGWQLQHDTLERQDRLRCMTRSCWERLCCSAKTLPGFEAWAAISGGELAGAVIICQFGDIFEVPYAMSRSCFLSNHVNNVLFYSVTREVLGRQGVQEVFFTVQPLDAPASVDDFKLRMGFTPRAVRQRVHFHPWVAPFLTPMIHAGSKWLLHRDPGHPIWPKVEGMLRFHLQGKRPAAEQEWPESLLEQEDSLLPGLLGQQNVPHGNSG